VNAGQHELPFDPSAMTTEEQSRFYQLPSLKIYGMGILQKRGAHLAVHLEVEVTGKHSFQHTALHLHHSAR
jgi:hypothetical protein